MFEYVLKIIKAITERITITTWLLVLTEVFLIYFSFLATSSSSDVCITCIDFLFLLTFNFNVHDLKSSLRTSQIIGSEGEKSTETSVDSVDDNEDILDMLTIVLEQVKIKVVDTIENIEAGKIYDQEHGKRS